MQRAMGSFMRSIRKKTDDDVCFTQFPHQWELQLSFIEDVIDENDDHSSFIIPDKYLGDEIDELDSIEGIYDILEHLSCLPNLAELIVAFPDVSPMTIQWLLCCLHDLNLIYLTKRIMRPFRINRGAIEQILSIPKTQLEMLHDFILPVSLTFHSPSNSQENLFLWFHWLRSLLLKDSEEEDGSFHSVTELWKGMGRTSYIVKERITHFGVLLELITQVNSCDVDNLDLDPIKIDDNSPVQLRIMNRLVDNAVVSHKISRMTKESLKDTSEIRLNKLTRSIDLASLNKHRFEILRNVNQGCINAVIILASLWFNSRLMLDNVEKERGGDWCVPPDIGSISASIYYIARESMIGRRETDQLAILLRNWMTHNILLRKLISK